MSSTCTINPNRQGLRENHDAHNSIMEVIDNNLNNNQNRIIFLHLVKVFDAVNDNTLPHKVEILGISFYP